LPPSRVQRRPLEHYAFVTSNSDDFSALNGDKRQPHSELADHFATDNSTYRLGDAGLEQALHDEFGVEMAQMIGETYFVEEPGGLSDIPAAEKEMFDKVWYERSMRHDRELIADGKSDEAAEHRRGHARDASGSKRPMPLMIWGRSTRLMYRVELRIEKVPLAAQHPAYGPAHSTAAADEGIIS
jgi:hypothetical protein